MAGAFSRLLQGIRAFWWIGWAMLGWGKEGRGCVLTFLQSTTESHTYKCYCLTVWEFKIGWCRLIG